MVEFFLSLSVRIGSPFIISNISMLLLSDRNHGRLVMVQKNHGMLAMIHGTWQPFHDHGMIMESFPIVIMFHDKHSMACNGP